MNIMPWEEDNMDCVDDYIIPFAIYLITFQYVTYHRDETL